VTFLQLKGLVKRFGAVAALDGVSFNANAGSRTAIVGPSGSGKTTLLRLIAGFDVPDSGSITLGGEDLAQGKQAKPAHLRGIGVIAQDGALFPHLSVGDNIGFAIPRDEKNRVNLIAGLAETVGLSQAMLKRRPDELSGGQQQRVAIARALARKPRLMLLDEPFSALDTGLRSAMRKAVGEVLDNAEVTTILVTHDQAEALSFASQVAVMNNGVIVQAGAPRELYFRPENRMVAEFLGEAVIMPARIEGGMASTAFGTLPVHQNHMGGASHVMIRPEQIAVRRGVAGGDADGILAKVAATEFAGAQCLMTLDLIRPAAGFGGEGAAHLQQFVLHASAFGLPEPGETVSLAVNGSVHAFG
jgi:iron(III) transport system ATP-binding protein